MRWYPDHIVLRLDTCTDMSALGHCLDGLGNLGSDRRRRGSMLCCVARNGSSFAAVYTTGCMDGLACGFLSGLYTLAVDAVVAQTATEIGGRREGLFL